MTCTGVKVSAAIEKTRITHTRPGLLDRGGMLNIHEEDLFKHLVLMADILPPDYGGQEIEPLVADAMLDVTGYLLDNYNPAASRMEEAQVDAFIGEMMQAAIELRLTLPSNVNSLSYLGTQNDMIYVDAKSGGALREIRDAE